MVPHLNQINSGYGSRGLQVISVSDEQEWEISQYIEMHAVRYASARALGVGRMYGNRGFPHAWLIDSRGMVVWEGHTGRLSDAELNKLLGAPAAPGSVQGAPVEAGGDSWWIWLIIGPAVLFAAAMGWFLWSTRDRTSKYQTAYYPAQQYAPQPQAPPPGSGQLQYGAQQQYAAPQPFPQRGPQPPSYPMQEPYQQGYSGQPSTPDTRTVGKPNSWGAHGSSESPGAAGKPEPPPLEQRPYLGSKPATDFPPFDTGRNPPRNH